MKSIDQEDTICAIATPTGSGGIAVVRVSGYDVFCICSKIFTNIQKEISLEEISTRSIFYGKINEHEEFIDDVILCLFKAPHSYTGEDTIEISCHGSLYIQQKILQLLIDNGARLANPGEFTMRAFLNGKMDLTQAEAVADLISSNSKVTHKIAVNQMRGGYSKKIKELKDKLLEFAALIELELDFGEEDVEFANRNKLAELLSVIKSEIQILMESFSVGNALKNGIPVAIIGKPNVGKSTLLNALLNEERAIVSDIPGTTRDSIEDTICIDGVLFRFMDTAGLRKAQDAIESIGIERTFAQVEKASVVLYLFDVNETTWDEVYQSINEIKHRFQNDEKHYLMVANKIDLILETPHKFKDYVNNNVIFISAKRRENIHLLADNLIKTVKINGDDTQSILVSNARHYESLSKAYTSVFKVETGMNNNITHDFLAADIREVIQHLSEVTGEITSESILTTVFSKFCIGK